jgi:hypothetical protein
VTQKLHPSLANKHKNLHDHVQRFDQLLREIKAEQRNGLPVAPVDQKPKPSEKIPQMPGLLIFQPLR